MTGERYEAQVIAALRAVELRPPDAFLWFGRREVVRGEDARDPRERLVQAVARRLLGDFFSGGVPRAPRSRPVAAPDDVGTFVATLSQANAGRGAWEGGWRVAGRGAQDTLHVTRPDGLVLMAPAEQVRAERELSERAAVSVLLPKELRGVSPGFYVALGDSGTPPTDDRAGLYWNIAAAGAATLVARVTYALNGAGLPFSLQVVANPARLGRGDAAVLSVARTDCAAAIMLVRPLLRALAAHLSEPAPAFTKPLARGLAVAESPAGGRPFGEHRCRLLAEAVVAAGATRARTVEERVGAVRERFAAAGLRLDAPYLQPGADDAYS
ncbi:MAG TPA: T3SS effector HopA1 family protein [Solirubrobacteraceae bacterium]|nr:T3SS effector HopA1 family protein [Solirubrobacteraceae bacterium]